MFEGHIYRHTLSATLFADPSKAKDAAKAAAKKDRRAQKVREAQAEEEWKEKERRDLEVLMAEDVGNGDRDFDIKDIRKKEKEARRSKKGKKDKRKEVDEEVGKTAEDFVVDVQDPRFERVFEDFEYAIDPSNPRFSGTSGMKQILEEGRKRRKDDDVDDVGDSGKGDRYVYGGDESNVWDSPKR